VTPASTNPKLTDDAAAKGIRTVFRVCNRDDRQGKFAGEWLARTYAHRNLAVLDDQSPYGSGVAAVTADAAAAAGLHPALRESYARDSQDFSALIAKLEAAKVDVVYVGGYHDGVGLLVKQARAQGFKAEFVSDDALNTNQFWSVAGEAGEGVCFSDAVSTPDGFKTNGYAAFQAFAAAAKGAGSTDAHKMADWLRANHVATRLGDLGWDDKGDVTKQTYVWYLWRNGDFRPAPGS
jgi:branched-chain amino acid transport system substrate-binding protein